MEFKNGHCNDHTTLCAQNDPLNWGMAAESLKGSYFDEAQRMVAENWKPVARLGGDCHSRQWHLGGGGGGGSGQGRRQGQQ